MIQPALTPLHPKKEPRPIVAGETWTKRASQKTSISRPTANVVRFDSGMVYFNTGTRLRHSSERVFRETYE